MSSSRCCRRPASSAATPSRPARELLATDPPDRTPGWGIIEGLEEEQARHERILADLEAEIARLDQIYDAEIDRVAPTDLAQVMESLLDSYRAGNLLGGRLPVVLDGAFDGLAPAAPRRGSASC